MINLLNILTDYRDTLLKNIKKNITDLNNLISLEEILKKSIFGKGYNATQR